MRLKSQIIGLLALFFAVPAVFSTPEEAQEGDVNPEVAKIVSQLILNPESNAVLKKGHMGYGYVSKLEIDGYQYVLVYDGMWLSKDCTLDMYVTKKGDLFSQKVFVDHDLTGVADSNPGWGPEYGTQIDYCRVKAVLAMYLRKLESST